MLKFNNCMDLSTWFYRNPYGCTEMLRICPILRPAEAAGESSLCCPAFHLPRPLSSSLDKTVFVKNECVLHPLL